MATQNVPAKMANSISTLKEMVLSDSLDLCIQDLDPKLPNWKCVVKEERSCE